MCATFLINVKKKNLSSSLAKNASRYRQVRYRCIICQYILIIPLIIYFFIKVKSPISEKHGGLLYEFYINFILYEFCIINATSALCVPDYKITFILRI